MEQILTDTFIAEKECEYKGRIYTVRDNGEIFRHPKEGLRPSKLDEVWTFGKRDESTGYMLYGGVRVHQVVATAFHGEPKDPHMIVDHIDTNRCNNRPENLRWLTRLENALNNPITVKRIIMCCGSLEAFIENPSILQETELNKDISWMRRCSAAEAKIAHDNLMQWARKPVVQRENAGYGTWGFARAAGVDESVFQLFESDEGFVDTPSEFHPNVVQRNWSTPTEFPPCPAGKPESPLDAYLANLADGCVTSKNRYGIWTLLKASKHETEDAIIILSMNKDSIKPWALCKVSYQDGVYIHESLETFFHEDGGEKYFEIYCGREWTGEDCFDDYTR